MKKFKYKNLHIIDKQIMRKLTTAVKKILILSPDNRLTPKEIRFLTWWPLVWSSNEGHPGLKRWKSLVVWASRVVLQSKRITPPDCKVPRRLRAILRKSFSSGVLRLCILSLLQTYRLVQLRPLVDINSITTGFQGDMSELDKRWNYLVQACEIFSRHFKVKCLEPFNLEWVTSWSAGPNKTPAMMGLAQDKEAIKLSNLKYDLYYLYRALPIVNRERWNTEFDFIKSDVRGLPDVDLAASLAQFKEELFITSNKSLPNPTSTGLKGKTWLSVEGIVESTPEDLKRPTTSRLAFLSDKGGKTRVVALGDIFTQTLLAPIHRHIFGLLKQLPTDGTFDQDKQRDRIQEVTNHGVKCYSLDMTAATDRLPAFYQCWVLFLTGCLTIEQSIAWFRVVTKRSFRVQKGKESCFVRYSVGQPMGLLSSWATLALSHHLLVAWAAQCAYPQRKTFFEDYAVLGDDIAIWDCAVATQYKILLSHLGVEISDAKSFEEVGLAEFAKAFYKCGCNLKPISPALVLWTRLEGPTNTVANARELNQRVSSDIPAVDLTRWLEEITPLPRQKLTTLFDVYNELIWPDPWYTDPGRQLARRIIDFNKHCDDVESQSRISAEWLFHRHSVPYEVLYRGSREFLQSPLHRLDAENVISWSKLTLHVNPNAVSLRLERYIDDWINTWINHPIVQCLGWKPSDRMYFVKDYFVQKFRLMLRPDRHVLLGVDWVAWDPLWWGDLGFESILELRHVTRGKDTSLVSARRAKFRPDILNKNWRRILHWEAQKHALIEPPERLFWR